MLYEYGKRTRNFWTRFLLIIFSVVYILGAFLMDNYSAHACWKWDH